MTTAAERFAEWALGLRAQDLPAEVARAASRHLLDGIGVAVAAARTDAAAPALAYARGFHAPAEATVIATGARLPAPSAAFANGALVHALDFDDTHAVALVHATAAVLPAAFAVGEEVRASGAGVLAAAVAGYEIVARLGGAVPHGLHARGFHATSVCGVFSSALVASKLMGLTRAQTVNALGIAGSQASGSLEFLRTGASTKQLHPGFAAMSGIAAARLAAAGADGPASIFEGEYGLFRSFADARVDAATLTDGLGARWETTRISIKPYPACQLSFASLDALRAALAEARGAADIESIRFEVPPGSIPIVCETQSPRTPYEAKFSLAWCAAALALDGSLGVDSFEPERIARADVLALAARVTYAERAFDGAPADAPGVAEVTLRDGRTLRGEVATSRGGPEDPLGDDELRAKLSSNCGGDAAHLEELVRGLGDLPGIAPVLASTLAFAAKEPVA
jgi:2-methylcitrate dehydratase PrpD